MAASARTCNPPTQKRARVHRADRLKRKEWSWDGPQNARPRDAGSRLQAGWLLVNKVADAGENLVIQLHAQQPCAHFDAQVPLKSLQHRRGQIRLLPKQSQ